MNPIAPRMVGRTSCALVALAWALPLGSPSPAQVVGGAWTTDFQLDGFAPSDFLGRSVAAAGDVDGDGFADFLVCASGVDIGVLREAGKAYAISGATGRLLWEFHGQGNSDRLGVVSSAGDANADGVPDFVLAAPYGGDSSGGVIYLYSGADGALLWSIDAKKRGNALGEALAAAGDVDGDGHEDVLVGAPGSDPNGPDTGSARVYSGKDGSLIRKIAGQQSPGRFGTSVSGLGDVSGDSVPDLAIGARFESPSGLTKAGSVHVVSGSDGALLYRIDGVVSGDQLGSSLAAVGDVDGDGCEDFLIGAPFANGIAGRDSGTASLFSGATGTLLLTIEGTERDQELGDSVAGAGDVDLDGVPDLLVGSPRGATIATAGHVDVISGDDGTLIQRLHGDQIGDSFGWSLAGVGNTSPEQFPRVLIGAVSADPGGRLSAGSVYLMGIDPLLRTQPDIPLGGRLTLEMDFPASEAKRDYALLLSGTGTGPTPLGSVELPLTADLILLRMLTGWKPRGLRSAFGVLDSDGRATATYVAPGYLGNHLGRTFYAAALSYDARTLTARMSSTASAITVVP